MYQLEVTRQHERSRRTRVMTSQTVGDLNRVYTHALSHSAILLLEVA